MELTDATEYYHRIMSSESEEELVTISLEVQSSIIQKTITDEMEMMMLSMAIQLRKNMFIMAEMMMTNTLTTMMSQDDFDPEQAQLEQFHQEEFEDFKDGNVLPMKDFTKKKKD